VDRKGILIWEQRCGGLEQGRCDHGGGVGMFGGEEGMCEGDEGMCDHEDALGMCEEVLGMNAHEVELGIDYVLEEIFHVLTQCKSEWFHLGWKERFGEQISPSPRPAEEAEDAPREYLPQSEALCCRNLLS